MVQPDVKKVSLNHTTGKGATDTCRAKFPQWYIQRLLEHESMTATEIYIKARLPDMAMPKMREIPDSKAATDPLRGQREVKQFLRSNLQIFLRCGIFLK